MKWIPNPPKQPETDPFEGIPGFGKSKLTPLYDPNIASGVRSQAKREIAKYTRKEELEKLTTPNMRGFFPDSSPGRKSKELTFFDTETDDRGRILTVAAHKVVFNFDKLRFENAEGDVGFFRVYNPINVDKNIARTVGVHGLTSKVLKAFRKENNVQYSNTWDLSQYEELQKYIGESEVAGHNIVAADIPWLMRPTGKDFNADIYKKGFFDTLHYAKAIAGKDSAKLQDLAQKLNLTPASLGLQAHDSAADVVTNIKVFEALLRTNIQHPATAEALYALGMRGVQTHFKSALNLSEGIGTIIHGARGKPLYKLPYKGAQKAISNWSYLRGMKTEELMNAESIIDVKEAFDIPQDVYDQARSVSSYLGSNFGEEVMSDIDKAIMADYEGPLKSLVDRYRYLDTIKPTEPSGSFDKDSQRIIKLLRTRLSRTGAGAGEANIPFIDSYGNEYPWVAELRTSLRDAGYGDNPSAELMQRFARRALQENAFAYWQKQVQYNTTAGNIVAKDKQYAGLSWYEEFARTAEEDMSPARIEAYKADKKAYLDKQKQLKKQQAQEQKRLSKLSQAQYEARQVENQWRRKHEIEKQNIIATQSESMWKEYSSEQTARAQMENMWAARKEELKYPQPDEQQIHAYEYDRNYRRQQRVNDEILEQKERRARQRDYYDILMSRGEAERRARREMYTQPWINRATDRFDLEAAAAKGTDAYADALAKVIKRNKDVISVTQQLARIPIYNPLQIYEAASAQMSGIQQAAHGILPQFLERPGMRLYSAMRNLWNSDYAQTKATWNKVSAILPPVAAAAGTAAGLITGNPIIGMATGNIIQGAGGAITQIIGNNNTRKVTQAGEGIQHRLNLLGFYVDALLAPLRLFNTGLRMSVGLFNKLSSAWNYMPPFTLRQLTGTSWSEAQPLLAADRLMGFQAGTMSNLENSITLAGNTLYTSGQYDEKSMVAAARLGIFSTAYAAPGTMSGKEQTRRIVNNLVAQVQNTQAGSAQRDQLMSLINQYNPTVMPIIERMIGMGITDYNYFHDKRGWQFLSDPENAARSRTAHDFTLARSSLTEGLSWAGNKLWEGGGRDIMKMLDDVVWDFARGEGIDWDRVKNGLKGVWDKLLDTFHLRDFKLNLDFKNIFNSILDAFTKGFIWVAETANRVFGSAINSFITNMAQTKITGFDGTKLLLNFLTGKPLLEGMNIDLATPQGAREAGTNAVKTWRRVAHNFGQPGWQAYEEFDPLQQVLDLWGTDSPNAKNNYYRKKENRKEFYQRTVEAMLGVRVDENTASQLLNAFKLTGNANDSDDLISDAGVLNKNALVRLGEIGAATKSGVMPYWKDKEITTENLGMYLDVLSHIPGLDIDSDKMEALISKYNDYMTPLMDLSTKQVQTITQNLKEAVGQINLDETTKAVKDLVSALKSGMKIQLVDQYGHVQDYLANGK